MTAAQRKEIDVQRMIARKLSRDGYMFHVGPSNFWCDVMDDLHNIFIEVKNDKLAPVQLLYGSVVGVGDEKEYKPQYLGLANENECRFYKAPKYSDVIEFAQKIDPELKMAPSQVPHNLKNEAFELLGEPVCIITDYDKDPLDFERPFVFVTMQNIVYIIEKFQKYHIDVKDFISSFADVWLERGEISVIRSGGLIDTIHGNKVKSKPIRDESDRQFITNIRITPSDLKVVSSNFDSLEDISNRRELGKFYTAPETANFAHDFIIQYIEPDVIIEPYAGTGSLLTPFDPYVKYIVNDVDANAIDVAKVVLAGRDTEFHTDDAFGTNSADDLIKKWNLNRFKGKKVLIYSNPPFGTSRKSGSPLHYDDVEMRKSDIDYHKSIIKYGKGDLVKPSVGQMIEIGNKLNAEIIAFFSPFGIFMGRSGYNKLLKEMSKHYKLIDGVVMSGEMFNEVSGNKPISLTIWRKK